MISRFFDLKGLAPCGDHLAKTHLTKANLTKANLTKANLTKTHGCMVNYKGAFAWMTLKI
jgi:uncharacterized protein YjbI with pentapeptide repeats